MLRLNSANIAGLCAILVAVQLLAAFVLILNGNGEIAFSGHLLEMGVLFLSAVITGVVTIGLLRIRTRDRVLEEAMVAVSQLSVNNIDESKSGSMQFEEYARKCTQLVADAMNTDRVGIWLLSEDDQVLVATDIFIRSDGSHETGARLERAQYPKYFEAVSAEWAIDASDAENDHRTADFRDGYLKPLDIRSMLDSMLYSGEQLVGVVCIEQKRRIRRWSNAEIRFAGSVARLISLALEIEARRVAQREMQSALIYAESANEAKTSFLMNLSHEVRTPLNAIIGFSQLGELKAVEMDLQPDQDFLPLFKQSKRSGEHLLRMFEDLIDVSQIELGVTKIAIEPLFVEAILSDTISIVTKPATSKHISISVDCAEDIQVNADRKLMSQVLINLIMNSIKYSSEGTQVSINVANRDEQHCVISISDQGLGMNEGEIEVALQRFERLDNSSTKVEGGLGIGLPLAKQMVEMQGGQFEILSQKDRGTTIRILIPLEARQSDSMVA